MLRSIAVVARHEYINGLRRPGFLVMTALVPLAGLVGIGIATLFGGQAKQLLLSQVLPSARAYGVVDGTRLFTPVLPEYAERYKLYSDREAGIEALRNNEIAALLEIREDYLTTGVVRVVSRASAIGAATLEDSSRVRAFMIEHLLRGKVDDRVRQRAAWPLEVEAVALTGSGEESSGQGIAGVFNAFLAPYLLAMLLIVTIFVSAGYLLQGVAEEKETRVVEIVLSSITASELLAGKILGLGALGLTQMGVWLTSAAVLNIPLLALLAVGQVSLLPPVNVLALAVAYYVLGFTLYAALMAAAGSLGTTQRESQQLAGLFSLMAAIPFMLAGLLFTNPNAPFARVMTWIPVTAPTMMMLRLPMTEVPWTDIAVSLTGLVLTIPVAVWAAGKVFRLGLLMYGKRPALGQVWRALRAA